MPTNKYPQIKNILALISLLVVGFSLPAISAAQVSRMHVNSVECPPSSAPASVSTDLQNICSKIDDLENQRIANDQRSNGIWVNSLNKIGFQEYNKDKKAADDNLQSQIIEQQKKYMNVLSGALQNGDPRKAQVDTQIGTFNRVVNTQAGNAAYSAAQAANQCFSVRGGLNLGVCFQNIIKFIGGFALQLAEMILSLMNWIFSFALKISIIDFWKYGNLPVFAITFRVIRDLVNLVFFFILLYSALGIIMDLGKINWKQNIIHIVLVALLINFSMIIPKVIIDGTNILAMVAYDKVGEPIMTNSNGVMVDSGRRDIGKGLSQPVQKIISQVLVKPDDAVIKVDPVDNAKVAIFYFGGAILNLTTAFVLAAGAFMFIARTIMLIILIPMSPIFFAAWLIPSLNYLSKWWWSKLIDYALFAPAFLFPMLVVLMLLNS